MLAKLNTDGSKFDPSAPVAAAVVDDAPADEATTVDDDAKPSDEGED